MNTKIFLIIGLLFLSLEGIGQVNPTAAIKPANGENYILISRDTFGAARFIYDSVRFDISGDTLYFTDSVRVDLSDLGQLKYFANIAAIPTTLELGERIKIEDTGAEYFVQNTTVASFNGGAPDGVAVIDLTGGKYAVLQSKNNSYEIKWFGAVGDNVTSDIIPFEKASEYSNGKMITLSADTFKINTSVSLLDNTYFQGVEGTVLRGGLSLDNVSNIKIKGISFIKFSGDYTNGIRIQNGGANNIEISDCKFYETVIFQDLPTLGFGNNILIDNCSFYNSPVSIVAVVTIQLHMGNVTITNNNFDVYNYDGCVKLSNGSGFALIEGNNIKGDFEEEFMDCFTFKGNVTMSNNNFDVLGGGIFAVKSGTVANPNPYPYVINLHGNNVRKRESGNSLFYVSGAFGLSFEDSLQIVNITDNNFILQNSVVSTVPINVRGFHKATINNNIIHSYNDSNSSSIFGTGINDLIVSDNVMNMKMLFFGESSNPSGENYDTIQQNGNWSIIDNTITQFKGSDKGIYIFNIDSISLNISNNTIHAKDAINDYALRIVNSKLLDLQLKNNFINYSDLATSAVNKTDYSSSTYENKREFGNSWNSEQWTSNGDDLHNANIGEVGINFPSPTEKLEVDGRITSSNAEGFQIGNSDETARGRLYQKGGQLYLEGSGLSSMTFGNITNGDLFRFNYNGRLGIGTQSPSTQLHVVGSVRIENGLFDNSNDNGTSAQLLSSTGSGIDWIDAPTSDNIYNTDGSLTGNRIITSTGQSLEYSALDGNDINVSTFSDNGNTFAITDTGTGALSNLSQKPEYLKLTSAPMQLVNNDDYQLLWTDVETNSTTKNGGIGSFHYTNSEEPFLALVSQSGSSFNSIRFGGGDSGGNAATVIDFYTASNNTTTTGTRRMRINASGNLGLGLVDPTDKLEVDGVVKINDFIKMVPTATVPTSPASGWIYFDDGTNRTGAGPRYYNGSSWVDL